jgi:hypothetical protein
MEGFIVGLDEGCFDGDRLDGFDVGLLVGRRVIGERVGGSSFSAATGDWVGLLVGLLLGLGVGTVVGLFV